MSTNATASLSRI